MSITGRVIPIIVSLTAIVGCAPLPIERIVYPTLEGRLLDEGAPLVNQSVHFSYSGKDACEDKGGKLYQTTKTDVNGEFTIVEKRRWSLFRLAVPADGYAHYNLCFVSPSGEKRWFFASDLRTPDWAEPSRLSCEFSDLHKKPISLEGKLSFNEAGCSVVNQYERS